MFSRQKLSALLAVITLSFLLVRCDKLPYAVDEPLVENLIEKYETILSEDTDEEPSPPENPEDPIQQANLDAVLYAYYPFNENARDESGNGHDAVAVGPQLTEDRFGNPNSAYLFDGTDDYIILENCRDFPSGNTSRSLAGWFRSSNTENEIMMLFGFGCPLAGYNFQIGIGPNYEKGRIEFRVNGWDDAYDWRTGTRASDYLDGEWHHVAVTYDGMETKIYFDGIFTNSTTSYRYITDPENMHLVIGREIDLEQWEFDGELDDIAIYTGVLTEEEIKEMGEPPPPPSDQYAYYPFNGNATDESGNGHDAAVSGATLTTDRFGNENSAYAFDGVDDYIIYTEMADFPAGRVDRTICGWFKSSVTDPYIMMMFGFGAQKNGYNFQVGIGPGASGTQYRVNGWGDSFDWRTGVTAPTYLDGQWHHCAVTYDGTTTKAYFDGELINQTTAFSYTTDPERMVLVIGREIDLAGWEWEGALDDVGIYTRVLDEDEIAELATQ